MLHVWRREVQCAKEYAEAVITFSNERGFIHALSRGISKRGWALAQQEAVEEGLRQLDQGLATLQDTGTVLGLPQHFALLAEAYMRGGQVDAGLHVLTEALEHVDKMGERGLEAEIYRLKGECLRAQTDKRHTAHGTQRKVDKAEECFRQALDVARRQQAKSLELRAALSLSRLWQQQGRYAEAHQILAESYGWFTEGFDTADLQEAKALLEALA
jgi:predicted ATPase